MELDWITISTDRERYNNDQGGMDTEYHFFEPTGEEEAFLSLAIECK